MEGIMSKLPQWAQIAAMYLGALTVVATIVVRFTKSKRDDEMVSKVTKYIWKVIDWLPTIGVNPKSKAYKDAYEKLSKNESSTPPN